MNILLIGLMMGLMLVFSRSWGHHKPSPAPEHHATKPEEAVAPSSKATGAARQPDRDPGPDPKATREAAPAPPVPKAE